MNSERSYDLESVRADGWFDRVLAGVPALEKLCGVLGDPLVALSLAAGFRIVSAVVERNSGDVASLTWVREDKDGNEVEGAGAPVAMRVEVMAALLGEADVLLPVPEQPDAAALGACIGQRHLLLAPLFGLTLRRLIVISDEEPRVVAFHDGIEEVVPVRQLWRFLRSRVVEALQVDRGHRPVSIDMDEAEAARVAFAEGRNDEVIARLAGWVAPLMIYLRTPEGAGLEARTRADIARALGILGEAFNRLGRSDECEEALRLAVQYGQDSPAAGELYHTLARVLLIAHRYAEAIALLRRALSLDPGCKDALVDLAKCFAKVGRVVAAFGCVRQAVAAGVDPEKIEPVDLEVRALLGRNVERYEELVGAPSRPRD